MKNSLKLFATTAIAAVISTPAIASETALATLIDDSTTKVDLRYRYEGVSQDGLDEDAAANTLRTRVSVTSGTVNNFTFKVEMDDSRALGSDNFNSTANGNTDYPVVADPEGTDLNQAYVQYKSGSFTTIAGRQRILLDDQRFVGGVGWRQNEQTYDGLTFKYATGDFTGSYSYINNVNRIFGPTGAKADLRGDVHLANGSYALSPSQKLTGFYYSLAFDNAAAISSDTFGLRYTGKFGPTKATLSYATQSEAGDNPTEYTADYLLADLSYKAGPVTLIGGYEVLGSDEGTKAFTTPLATLHKFQGWNDKFLATPAGGIEDLYFGAAGKAGSVTLKAFYHAYSSESSDDDLGSEINAVAVYPVNKKVKTVLKYSNYSADTHATDTSKLWFMVQVSL